MSEPEDERDDGRKRVDPRLSIAIVTGVVVVLTLVVLFKTVDTSPPLSCAPTATASASDMSPSGSSADGPAESLADAKPTPPESVCPTCGYPHALKAVAAVQEPGSGCAPGGSC